MSGIPTDFTPLSALVGGSLIGLSSAVLYAGFGRIAGISGILNNAIEQRAERSWRVVFLLALVTSASLWLGFGDHVPRSGFSVAALIIAGLLVGFGTRLGSGCTSGHGICGLARLSKRSLAAVLIFMGAGFATVYLLRHVMVWPP